MPRFFSIFSPLLRLFPITLSPPPLFPFAHASFFFFSSSLLSPLNFGTLEPRIGSLVGRFQGFPRLSYKAKTWLERVDIHSTRARPTFTTQTWISMVFAKQIRRGFANVVDRVELLLPRTRGKIVAGIRDYGLAL